MAILKFGGKEIECTDVFIHADVVEWLNRFSNIQGKIKIKSDRPLLADINGNVDIFKISESGLIRGNVKKIITSSNILWLKDKKDRGLITPSNTICRHFDENGKPLRFIYGAVADDSQFNKELEKLKVKYKNEFFKATGCKPNRYQILHIDGKLASYRVYGPENPGYGVLTKLEGNVENARTLSSIIINGSIGFAELQLDKSDFNL